MAVGKPCALIAHARFDEGGQVKACSLLYPLILHSIPAWLVLFALCLDFIVFMIVKRDMTLLTAY